MAEVLYQFLENDGELAVLAVHDQFEPSNRPLAHGFELDLRPPRGKSSEVDIFSADGYRLWIGEAKTDGRFESGRLAFIAGLTSLLDAYGVLSQPRWFDGHPRHAMKRVRYFCVPGLGCGWSNASVQGPE